MGAIDTLDIEGALVGRVIAAEHDLVKARENGLQPWHFGERSYQTLFEQACSLYDSQHPVNISSVSLAVRKLDTKKRNGLPTRQLESWIAEHCQITDTTDLRDLVSMLQQDWGYRTLSNTATKLLESSIQREYPAEKLLEATQLRLDKMAAQNNTDDTGDVTEAVREMIDWAEKGRGQGIKSGYKAWDNLTGGFGVGQLHIVAAGTSMGKSAWAHGLLDNIAISQKVPTAIWSLEMSKGEVMSRVASRRARIPLSRILKGKLTPSDFQPLATVSGEMTEAPMWIFDRPGVSASDIAAKCIQIKREGLRMVIIDQLDLMEHPKADRKDLELRETTKALKNLARRYDLTVVLLHQINRAHGSRSKADKEPTLTDLRDGAVENDADVVTLLHRPDKADPDKCPEHMVGMCSANVAKNRNGPTARTLLAYRGECVRFEEPQHDPAMGGGYEYDD